MVKGRRKRALGLSAINARTLKMNETHCITSSLKKETKLVNNIKRTENEKITSTLAHKTSLKKSTNSPGFITSYLLPQIDDHSNKSLRNKQNTTTNGFMTEHVLFQSDYDSKIKLEKSSASPIKEIFETDETPVAVPHHDPPTPHRINMPNILSNDTDTINSTKYTERRNQCVTNQCDVKLSNKKVLSQGRGKSKYTASFRNIANLNHKVTEYFPVRRSVRKCKKTVLEEKQRDLENKVLCEIEDGLEVKHFVGKGRGVVTTREFMKGEFVVEYAGDLIDQIEAKKREVEYAKDQNTGCYMYYFQHRNHQYCVDATAETGKLGRLVNHCRNGNLIARVVEIGNTPHLVLTAKEDISSGVELNYDYGDRSRESIRNHPWLAL